MEQFWTYFWSAIGLILTALAGWISTKINAWLDAKTAEKKDANCANTIDNIILSAVKSVFQTYVEVLKNGDSFNEDAQKEAKRRAMMIIESQLTMDLRDYITNHFGDIKDFISNKIESAIYSLKK